MPTCAEILSQARVITRCTDTNANPDTTLMTLLQIVYERLFTTIVVENRYYIGLDMIDLALTGVYTTLPEGINPADIVEVHDRTNATATQLGEQLTPVTAPGAMRSVTIGYTLVGNTIALTNGEYSNITLRLFTRRRPEQLIDTKQTPLLIPQQHHDALVWGLAEIMQGRDGMVDQYIGARAQESLIRLLAYVGAPSTFADGPHS